MSKELFDEMASGISRDYPDEWRTVYPRIFQDPGGYHSAKELAVDLWTCLAVLRVENWEFDKLSALDNALLASASLLTSLKVPTYYLSRGLMESVLKEYPTTAVRWSEIKLPTEAGVFVIPKGAVSAGNGKECSYLWYARLRNGVKYAHPFATHRRVFSSPAFSDQMVFRINVAGEQGKLASFFSDLDYPVFRKEDFTPESSPMNADKQLDKQERELSSKMLAMLFGVLTEMGDHPSLVQYGVPLGKKSKSGSEFWSATTIGAFLPEKAHHPDRDIFQKSLLPEEFKKPEWSDGTWADFHKIAEEESTRKPIAGLFPINFYNRQEMTAEEKESQVQLTQIADHTILIADKSEIGREAIRIWEQKNGRRIEGAEAWDTDEYSFYIRAESQSAKELNVASFAPTINALLDSVIPDFAKKIQSIGGCCAVMMMVEPHLCVAIEDKIHEVQPSPADA